MQATEHDNVLLVVALPCIGGCNWQRVNETKPGGAERIQEHKDLFYKLLAKAKIVADAVCKRGGTMTFELGNNNQYWQCPTVQMFLERFGLLKTRLDGCAYGLTCKNDVLIKKPWRMMTNNTQIIAKIDGNTCQGGHPHATCENAAVTSMTPGYPRKLACDIHVAFAKHVKARTTPAAVAAPNGPIAANAASYGSNQSASKFAELANPLPKLPRKSSDEATTVHREINAPLDVLEPIPACIARKVGKQEWNRDKAAKDACLLYTSPSPRDQRGSRMPSSA